MHVCNGHLLFFSRCWRCMPKRVLDIEHREWTFCREKKKINKSYQKNGQEKKWKNVNWKVLLFFSVGQQQQQQQSSERIHPSVMIWWRKRRIGGTGEGRRWSLSIRALHIKLWWATQIWVNNEKFEIFLSNTLNSHRIFIMDTGNTERSTFYELKLKGSTVDCTLHIFIHIMWEMRMSYLQLAYTIYICTYIYINRYSKMNATHIHDIHSKHRDENRKIDRSKIRKWFW